MIKQIVAGAVTVGITLTLVPATANASTAEDTYLIVADQSSGVSAMSATSIESTVENVGGEDVDTFSTIGAATAEMTAAEAATLDAKPGYSVTKDAKISIDPGTVTDSPKKGKAHAADETHGTTRQVSGAAVANSWGLDRIDQRDPMTNGNYTRNPGVTGAGVHVYVFDTGVKLNHPEFAGRIGRSWDMVGDGNGANDYDGHGTHVAGIIASSYFGVAPKATIHPVQVLGSDGYGYWSDFIAGLNAVAASKPPAASVANVSLGGGYNSTVNQAVANFTTATKMPVVVAAGNSGDDVSYYSPASASSATTVAATEEGFDGYDYDAYYSNYGTGVDIYAPGSDIWSTDLDPAYMRSMSGTSMAAPHVAGWYALYFGANPTATASTARTSLVSTATTGTVYETYGGTPNRIAYTSSIRASVATKATANSAKSKFLIDVNPDKGSGYWTFTVQKWDGRKWVNKSTYNTYGSAETRTLDLPKGKYRAVVAAKYGYRTTYSASVTLLK